MAQTQLNAQGFTPEDRSAVERYVRSSLGDYVTLATPQQFGAVVDGVTDDYAAIQAAIDSLAATGGALYFPAGTYRSSAQLVVSTGIHMFGDGVVQDARAGTVFAAAKGSTIYFDAGVGGLLARYITASGSSGTADIIGSGGLVIERLRFLSAGGGVSAAGKYGLDLRSACTVRDCEVRGFGDHGVYLRGSQSGTDGVVYGNVNGSRLEQIKSLVNYGDGFKISGNDANVIKIDTCTGQLNTGWSFTDDGLICNTYLNCIHEGSVAGGYRTLRASAINSWLGCETEGGSHSFGAYDVVRGGNLESAAGVPRWQNYSGVTIRNGKTLQLNSAGDAGGLTLSNNGTNLAVSAGVTATGAVTGSNLSGTNTGDETYGTITTKLAGGSGGGTTNFLRADGTFAAPAGSGGTVTSVSVTTANGVSGSVANPTTTPAISLTLGAITPSSVASTGAVSGTSITGTAAITSSGATNGIGYATGAGGTITQNTSKATGVTLNKACGEITMNGAALAASTTVSFVLTNSAIAAGDNLLVNHVATGTIGLYLLNAVCAAGSATIYVRNTSAGSLSEAIKLRFTVLKGVTA